MTKVVSYEQLLEQIEIVKAKKEGYVTNFYLDKHKVLLWADHDLLTYIVNGNTLFIVKEEEAFVSLYYCTTSIVQLEKDLDFFKERFTNKDVVIDILGNASAVENVATVFLNHSFKNYATLRRMVSATAATEAPVDSAILPASADEANDIAKLLHRYFDPLCEQIPLIEELKELAQSNRILLCKEGDIIVGFLIYTLTGATSYLRYWFTHPDHRDKKIGSRLFRRFVKETEMSQRRLFWVLEDNENAIKRYLHYGFLPENMLDKVLIRKK